MKSSPKTFLAALLLPALALAEDDSAAVSLTDMRHQHLWIAYAIIWGLVFVFVARTAMRQAQTQRELDRLASRLDALEKPHG